MQARPAGKDYGAYTAKYIALKHYRKQLRTYLDLGCGPYPSLRGFKKVTDIYVSRERQRLNANDSHRKRFECKTFGPLSAPPRAQYSGVSGASKVPCACAG